MQQIETYQRLFQQYLSSHPFKSEPESLYEPINYIMELGGKRLRPVLALLGYTMFEERPEKALPGTLQFMPAVSGPVPDNASSVRLIRLPAMS